MCLQYSIFHFLRFGFCYKKVNQTANCKVKNTLTINLHQWNLKVSSKNYFCINNKNTDYLQVIFFKMDCAIFYTKLHELFCQFISWTNWVNSGKFMDNCWISCQVMADMEKVFDDLIIINLFVTKDPNTKNLLAVRWTN